MRVKMTKQNMVNLEKLFQFTQTINPEHVNQARCEAIKLDGRLVNERREENQFCAFLHVSIFLGKFDKWPQYVSPIEIAPGNERALERMLVQGFTHDQIVLCDLEETGYINGACWYAEQLGFTSWKPWRFEINGELDKALNQFGSGRAPASHVKWSRPVHDVLLDTAHHFGFDSRRFPAPEVKPKPRRSTPSIYSKRWKRKSGTRKWRDPVVA